MEDDSKEDEEEVVNYGNAPSPPKPKLPSFENLDESLLTGPSVIKG